MSLYANPSLYRAFFAPSVELRTSIDALVRKHVGAKDVSKLRVLDPACGPATWIEHFADRGAKVVGIDIEPKAVKAARLHLGDRAATVVEGDMRQPPASVKGPFALAINPDNSVGHLGGLADVAAHLSAMHRLLRSTKSDGGHYVVGLAVREPGDELDVGTVYERGPVEVGGGGLAALRTETLGLVDVQHPDGLRCERIRHTILAVGVEGVGPIVLEQYDLLTFPFATLRALLAANGPWTVVDYRDATDEALPRKRLGPGAGDVLLTLRADKAATPSARRLRLGRATKKR